jgi:hypothetical protein
MQLAFEGWTETERDQLNLNISSLEARIKKIPEEIDLETKTIQARYVNPTPRLFPVAVTYLVPEDLTP